MKRPGRTLLTSLAVIVLLGACTSTGPIALDLQGAWTLTWDGGAARPDFGTDGAMTLDVAGTSARFVGRDDASGVKRCQDLDVSLVAGTVVVLRAPAPFGDELETWSFLAERVDATTIRLHNEIETLTLRRRTGAPPVADCPEVAVALVAELVVARPSSMKLQSVGSTLYMNTGDDGVPIVGIDAATGAITSSRTLTDSVGFGSLEPYLFAAASDDLFFGTCRCGRSDRFTHFDLATDTALTQIDTEANGAHVGIRFGYVDPVSSAVVIGGTGYEGGAEASYNRLVSLDPTTFAVLAARDVLPGTFVDDVALLEGRLLALLGEGPRYGDVVEVGADGLAIETYALQGRHDGVARGIAAVGDVLYLVVDDFLTARVLLYSLAID